MKKRIGCLVALCLMCLPFSAWARGGGAGKAGTLGFGVEGTVSLVPHANLRVGAQYLNFGFDITESDVKYDIDLKFRSLSLLLDLYPAPSFGFRLSGGMVLNHNKANMVGGAQATYDIGGTVYTGAEIGHLVGKMTFRETAPYAGIGWGNAAVRRVGLALDIGVVFQGEPNVDLNATGPVSANTEFAAELQRERREIEAQTDEFKYYPVVSIGLNFKIW